MHIMDIWFLIGRVIYVIPFLMFGMNHLQNADAMTGYAQSKGVPNARAATLASGVVWIIGGLSVGLGVFGDLGALLLAGQLVVVTALMHQFWTESDPEAQMPEMVNFMKNVSLIGAAIVVFAMYAVFGEGLDYTFTDQVISIDP